MPTLAAILGDAVSIAIDDAGAEETAAIYHMRKRRWRRAALALRKAQSRLADAECELLSRTHEGCRPKEGPTPGPPGSRRAGRLGVTR